MDGGRWFTELQVQQRNDRNESQTSLGKSTREWGQGVENMVIRWSQQHLAGVGFMSNCRCLEIQDRHRRGQEPRGVGGNQTRKLEKMFFGLEPDVR